MKILKPIYKTLNTSNNIYQYINGCMSVSLGLKNNWAVFNKSCIYRFFGTWSVFIEKVFFNLYR